MPSRPKTAGILLERAAVSLGSGVLPGAVAGPGPGHFPTGSVVPAPRKTWVFVPFLSGKTEKIGSRPLDRRSKLSTTCTTNRARCCPGSHSSTDGGTIAEHLISGFARDEHDPPLDGPRLLPCDQQLVQLLFASDEGSPPLSSTRYGGSAATERSTILSAICI